MTDDSGTTLYKYSAKGEVVEESRTIYGATAGNPFVTKYSYDQNGNPKTTTYPSGRRITNTIVNDRITMVQSALTTTTTVASGITYKPFGGVSQIVYGNNLTGTFQYDDQYRVRSLSTGAVLQLSYNGLYDANGNITGINDSLDGTKNRTFTYDSLDRLDTAVANGLWGSLDWDYDGVGNRTNERSGGIDHPYIYPSSGGRTISNRLTSANGRTYGYDGNGNTEGDGIWTYVYNQNQRMITAYTAGVTVNYVYNGHGQRVKKSVSGGDTTIYHYDLGGRLISETTTTGLTIVEYVYLNGQPLAKMEGESTYYYHNDHLGTPQKMTDASGAVVWAADYKPFGEATITVSTITNNLRFPGQYYDQETGLHNNYFRDYNPVIGRYIEKDPIGQWGGVNLFAYSSMNPIKRADRTGLWGEDVHSGINNNGYGTYTWAQQVGIPPDIAQVIAIANNATDNNGNWSLVIGVPGRHFNTSMGGRDSRDIFAELDLQLAIDQYNKGNKCSAYKTLGRGLHSVQDQIAHMGWFPALPHPSWYDDASLRVDALQQTGTATLDYLLRFLGGISQ